MVVPDLLYFGIIRIFRISFVSCEQFRYWSIRFLLRASSGANEGISQLTVLTFFCYKTLFFFFLIYNTNLISMAQADPSEIVKGFAKGTGSLAAGFAQGIFGSAGKFVGSISRYKA